MSERQTKAGNQITLTHSLILSLSYSLTLSLSQSHILSFTHSCHTEQLLFSCSKVTLSLSHYLTLSISNSHSLTLGMLNNFCFDVYAQMSLFIDENVNGFFDHHTSITLTCYFRCHRAGSQLIKN